jgi:hypothetical protein
MKSQKLMKSTCESAWLFNVKQEGDLLMAGFACFVHSCPMEVKMVVNGKERKVMVPARAVNGAVPLRMMNARLSLLPLTDNE